MLLGGTAAPAPRAAVCVAPPEGAVPTWELEGHPELAALASTIRTILERNHARYPGPNGAVEGYDAGPSYGDWNTPLLPDLIFARDLATILPLARFYAGAATLRSGLEEFLRLQYTDQTTSADGDLGLPIGPIWHEGHPVDRQFAPGRHRGRVGGRGGPVPHQAFLAAGAADRGRAGVSGRFYAP